MQSSLQSLPQWPIRLLVPLVLLSTSCKGEELAPRISGQQLVKSQVRDLYPAPNGSCVATLAGTEPTTEPGAPQDIFLGSLWIAPAGTGSPRRLGGEVSNLAGSVAFSADSKYIAFLAGYSVRHAAGELRLAKTEGGDTESLGDGVKFYAFSPSSEWIAWVTDGVLYIRKTAGGEPTRVTDGVALVEFGPKDTPSAGRMLIKRSIRFGGALLVDDLSTGKLSAVARAATAFGFSPTGDGFAFEATALLPPGAWERPVDPTSKVGLTPEAPGLYRVTGREPPKRLTVEPVADFKFSPTGSRIAFLTLPTAGPTGDLYVSDGGAPDKVANHVNGIQFTPDGSLVLLGNWSGGGSAGTLGVLPPHGDLVQLAMNVPQFTVSPKGGYVLYTQSIIDKGALSYGLAAYRLGTKPPESSQIIDNGVQSFTVDPDDKHLAYKAHCVDAGKSCVLFVSDLSDPTKPVQLAKQVTAFEFAPSGLVVVTSRREANMTGRILFSLGLMAPVARAPILTLDDQMEGEFVLAGPEHKRVLYLVNERSREGLYGVDLGTPPPPLPLQEEKH